MKIQEFLYDHVWTGSGYGKKHLKKSHDATIGLSEKRFHKTIGTLEHVPIVGSLIGLAEGLYKGARSLIGRIKISDPNKKVKAVELIKKRILPPATPEHSLDEEFTDSIASEERLSQANSDKSSEQDTRDAISPLSSDSIENVDATQEPLLALKVPTQLHYNLMDLLLKLYPHADRKGICLGFCVMGMQAIFLNQISQFNRRLEKLEKLIEATLAEISAEPEVKDLFDVVIKKLQESKDFDVLAFLEGVHICMQGNYYPTLREPTIEPTGHLSPNFIGTYLSLVASESLESKGKVAKVNNIARTSTYTEAELAAHFSTLQKNLDDAPRLEDPIAIVLTTIHNPHAMTIGYDPQEKTWILINVNTGLAEKVVNTESLAKKVMSNFEGSKRFEGLAMAYETYALTSDSQEIKSLETKESNAYLTLCANGDENKIVFYFDENTDWLVLAVIHNDLDTLKKLLERGIDPDTSLDNIHPLPIASLLGHTEIALYLINKTQINLNAKTLAGNTALHTAISYRRQEILKALVSNPRVDLTLKTKQGITPLELAIRSKSLDSVEILLSKKDRLGNYMEKALFLASKLGLLSIVKLLLENGEASQKDKDRAKNAASGPDKGAIIELLK